MISNLKYLKTLYFLFFALIFLRCIEEPAGYIGLTEDEKPVVEILSPVEMDTITSDLTLSIYMSDYFGISTIHVYLNAQEYVYYPRIPLSWTFNLDQLVYGVNTINVRAEDNFGNYSDVKSRRIFVNKPPMVTNPIPLIVRYFNGDKIQVQISNLFSDDNHPSGEIIKSIDAVSSPEGLSAEIYNNSILVITPKINPAGISNYDIVIKGKSDNLEALSTVSLNLCHSWYIGSRSLYEVLEFKVGNQYVSNVGYTQLYLDNRGISSTEGIEQFTNLIYLNLSNNSFTFLDLSNAHNLEDLTIDSGELDSLILPSVGGLSYIGISNTKLRTLNLSPFYYLRQIHVTNNLIENFSLPDSLCFDCYVWANDNKIKNLDFKNIRTVISPADFSNNEINEVYLRRAGFSTRMDLSGNNISSLVFQTINNYSLRELYLQENNLQNLDIRGLSLNTLYTYSNPQLEEIYVTQQQKHLIDIGSWNCNVDSWTRFVVKL